MSKEAQVDKKEIGALLEELDGLRKLVADEWERDEAKAVYQVEPWHGDCDHYGDLVADFATKEAADAAVALHHAYPELRAYIRKAEKVIAAAVMLAAIEGATQKLAKKRGIEVPELHRERLAVFEAALAALADLDEGDTDGD